MKQIEYTEKQKEVLQILEPFIKLANQCGSNAIRVQVKAIISATLEKYGIKEQYLTLREYLNKHSIGAYHHFIFNINNVCINVIDDEDFETTYKSELLDQYYVINDTRESFGGNCENYECRHNLELEEIER